MSGRLAALKSNELLKQFLDLLKMTQILSVELGVRRVPSRVVRVLLNGLKLLHDGFKLLWCHGDEIMIGSVF